MITVADSIGIKLLTPTCLLTGVGNEIHQYRIDSFGKTVLQQISSSFRCKIYGISSYQNELNDQNESNQQFVVVYGGREVAIFLLRDDLDLKLITRLTLNDWISTIRVYKPISNDVVSFCVVSAHSVASEFNVNINGKWSIEHKSSCVDKCTLYCSLIIGDSWEKTTIFGGTAFGELIIWTPNGESPREVFQRVTGHNGVIFSIDCSLKYNLITTTSDDRSVKVWNLKFPTNSSEDWSDCTVEPTKSMFGHTARIFSHKIIEYNNKVYIITVGEDGNICVWSPDGRLVNRVPISSNVSLWNLDYDGKRQYLFASGNDGNVHQLNLKNILNETSVLCENIQNIDLEKGEHVEKLVIMQDEGVVVMLTNQHKLLYGKIDENATKCSWKTLSNAETGYKITVLETHGSFVATAGYQFITIYQFKDGQFNKVYHDKFFSVENSSMVMALKFLSESEFVVCDARGNGSILTINENFELIENQTFQMPPCKERWITVALRCENYLIIGDRHGNMHLYEISDKLTLKHTLWHVHGKLGCKTIFHHSKNGKEFNSAGHQGKVKTIIINENTMELELKSTHDIPIKWCDKSLNHNQNVLLAGFNERHFIVWCYDNSYRFEFDCGGGHRSWDLFINKKTGKANLFFVRSKLLKSVQFYMHDNTLHPFNILKNNWHTRPCNTMRIIELTDERFLIASGGDDNLLKFNEINMLQSSLLNHHFDMVLHISNIRSVFSLRQSTESNSENWLIFSAGGRAQICVTQFKFDEHQNIQFYENCDFMLRSSDLERKRTKQTQIIYFDPETRFMSLVAYYKENEICLVVGCSDGFIRTFKYANGSITLDTSTFYGRCILNVHHFTFDGRNYLISMATDGLITFWYLDNFNENSQPFWNVQHHDSGINSFDIFIDGSRMCIATGGDDQSIVISKLQIQKEVEENIKILVDKTTKFPYEHTAQVNGVKFSKDRQFLYSTSVDQTVMKIDLNDFSIKQSNYSCISDAKGLQIINSNHILVYGCGMQVLKV